MEAFAVASSFVSVVSLGIQLAEKVQMLHDFWNSFQDAPAKIKRIAEDLDSFARIIQQGVGMQHSENATLRKLLERAEDKITKLETLVEKFEPKFGSKRLITRKWAAFRATLNKGNIEEFQRSLGDTKLDLILIGQAVAEQSLQHNRQKVIVSLASLKSEIRNDVYDIRREVQEILQQIRLQTDPLASGTVSIDIKEVFSKAVTGAAQSLEMGDIIQRLNGHGKIDQQSSQKAPGLGLYQLDRTSSQSNHEEVLAHPDNNASTSAGPIATKAYRRTFQRSKHVVKRGYWEFSTFLGTVKWRTRTVEFRHGALTRDDDERFELETDITLQPSRWLSVHCLRMKLSRATAGLACNMRLYSIVPPESLIFTYCKNSDLSGVRDLLQHGYASPWDTSPDGRTPIHFAAGSSDFSICQLLIQAGANVDAEDDLGQTPIHYASRFGSRKPEESVLATFRALVEYGGADTTVRDAQGANILNEVGWSSQECIGMAWLLKRGDVEMDVRELNFGRTAIMTLVYGSLEHHGSALLKTLIDRGVDIQAQKESSADDDEGGYTALHFAIRNICEEPYQHHGSSLLSLLLEKGANPHVSDCSGKTPTAIALSTSSAFCIWREAVYGYQRFEDFIMEELRQSTYLCDDGWNEHSLLGLFECGFTPVLSVLANTIRYDYHETFWETDVWEPWWLELQCLIKRGQKPLPPLPPNWQKTITSDGVTPQYLNLNTGMRTQKRPEGIFFSNLKTYEAQQMYKDGRIKIETQKPFNLINKDNEQKAYYKTRGEVNLASISAYNATSVAIC